jgi:Predicted extracellular nuclease
MTRLPLPSLALFATLTALALPARAAIIDNVEVFWDFGEIAAPTVTPTVTPTMLPSAPFTVSTITPGNQSSSGSGWFGTQTDATTSPGGAASLGLRVKTEPSTLNEATCHYFSWTLTHLDSLAPQTYTLAQFSMYTRRTGAGPAAWKLIAYDGVSSVEVASGVLANTTAWPFVTFTPNISFETNSSIEFRLYGYDATGSTAINWRIDDLKLNFSYDDGGVVIPTLTPPDLSESASSASSITVEWQTVDAATGYYFDASESPDFVVGDDEIAYCPGTSLVDLRDWIADDIRVVTSSSVSSLVLTNGCLTSPALDLTGIPNARFTFNARFYNNPSLESNLIRVRASLNPNDWSAAEEVGTFAPASNVSANNSTSMDLTPWLGQSIYLRLDTPFQNGNKSAAVDNLRVESILPSFLADYNNLHVNGTSVMVSGLTHETTYYFRARSSDGTITTENSATLSATTLPVDIAQVVNVDIENLKHETATLTWDDAMNATRYGVEIYKTNYTANLPGAHVIITKVFSHTSGNKAIEITNIGDETADLNEYSTMRANSSSVWGASTDLKDFALRHGASLSLAPGMSILLIYATGASDDFLKNAVALGGTANAMNLANDQKIALLHDGVIVDIAISVNGIFKYRAPFAFEGRDEVVPAEWETDTYDATNGAALAAAHPYYTYALYFSLPQTPTAATEYNLTGLKHETYYLARVRGVNGSATGPWSDYVDFITDPQPKTTIIVIR